MKTLIKLLFIVLMLEASGLALAQIPPTQRSDGVAYITGGVGDGEADAIVAEAKQWPLMLELSQLENGRGVWIFGANIKVNNSKKATVFDAKADGPYMLINLDPGDYVIEATYEGVLQTRAISIKANSPQKISLFWK
jgi:hypothetical protein